MAKKILSILLENNHKFDLLDHRQTNFSGF